MFDLVCGDIRPCLVEEEEYEHRQRRLDPEDLQGRHYDAVENDGRVHRDDPLVRSEKLFSDEAGSPGTLVPVPDMRIKVVLKKKETTGKPDAGIGEIDRPKHAGLHNERKVPPVKEPVMECKEPGKTDFVEPDMAGAASLVSSPGPLRVYRGPRQGLRYLRQASRSRQRGR
jgi:hypothetical protein